MQTIDHGRLFASACKLKRGVWPLLAPAQAREYTTPWRVGRGVAVRVGLEDAAVIGWWGRKRELDEREGLLHAMSAGERGLREVVPEPVADELEDEGWTIIPWNEAA